MGWLDDVRKIRNKLMHFRGELSSAERRQLQACAQWLSVHSSVIKQTFAVGIPAAPATDQEIVEPEEGASQGAVVEPYEAAAEQESLDLGHSRYSPLAAYLMNQPLGRDVLELAFAEVEQVIGAELPPFARQHRSWWANDSRTRVQSIQWLGAGWYVSEVDMGLERVVFARDKDMVRAYNTFYQALIDQLQKAGAFPRPDRPPYGKRSYYAGHICHRYTRVGSYLLAFTRDMRFIIDLTLDSAEQDTNKRRFDRLLEERAALEAAVGQALCWERRTGQATSAIRLSRTGAITDDEQRLSDLRSWAVCSLVKMHAVLGRRLCMLAEEQRIVDESNAELGKRL